MTGFIFKQVKKWLNVNKSVIMWLLKKFDDIFSNLNEVIITTSETD